MRLFRKSRTQNLAVAMAGVKLGDRLLVIGCGDPKLIAALALKTGLTGRACAVDPSAERTAEAARVAHTEGALIETVTAPTAAVQAIDESFDIVLLRDVLDPHTVREAWRVLRPGGRCLVVLSAPRGGLAGLFRTRPAAQGDAGSATRALHEAQFRGARTLAEREGMVFVEGVKPVT